MRELSIYTAFVLCARQHTLSRALYTRESIMAAKTGVQQQAAEQLNVDLIPGTEVMTDIGNSHLAKAGGNGSV